jgi:signal transduction histidine kinase
MRRRLMLVMVGLVAAGLVVAGAGGLILTRNAARNDAKANLVTEVQSLTSQSAGTQLLRNLAAVRNVLKLEDANFLVIDRAGTLTSSLPAGLTEQDVDVAALQAGQTVSGRTGSQVYAAAPVTLSEAERAKIAKRRHFEGTLAILLTQDVGGLGPSWGYFIVAGGAALLLAALVAWQMSRRMARPLVEAVEATDRIASGDLESRVPIRGSDYPEFSKLAGSINDMAQSLEDGRARERHLLLAVSHDLRTPLTSIRGFAEAIKDGAIEDDDEAADVIIAESRRLERLVGDLLDLTKLEAREMSINLRPTDAAEVVGTTTEGFRPAAAKSGLQILTELPDYGVDAPVSADPDRLAQLLANLLENAITFARTTVTVRVSDGVGACVVTVDDDGPGIAQGDLVRVFERFYRADRGPNRPMGSGLGLAIVAELAAAMGGTVRAESPVSSDGGSRFVLTLRRWPQPVPQPALT